MVSMRSDNAVHTAHCHRCCRARHRRWHCRRHRARAPFWSTPSPAAWIGCSPAVRSCCRYSDVCRSVMPLRRCLLRGVSRSTVLLHSGFRQRQLHITPVTTCRLHLHRVPE